MTYSERVRITWDDAKNAANLRKHGLSFAEARELLLAREDAVLVLFDETHSEDEDRFISVGLIPRGVVVVVWMERDVDEIRIISARMATRKECKLYTNYLDGLS